MRPGGLAAAARGALRCAVADHDGYLARERDRGADGGDQIIMGEGIRADNTRFFADVIILANSNSGGKPYYRAWNRMAIQTYF